MTTLMHVSRRAAVVAATIGAASLVAACGSSADPAADDAAPSATEAQDAEVVEVDSYPVDHGIDAAIDAVDRQALVVRVSVTAVHEPTRVDVAGPAPSDGSEAATVSYVYVPVEVEVLEVLHADPAYGDGSVSVGTRLTVRSFNGADGEGLSADGLDFTADQFATGATLAEGTTAVLFLDPPVDTGDGVMTYTPSYGFDVRSDGTVVDVSGATRSLTAVRDEVGS
jgi:hypothetical protein